jgi:hypothetical protein
MLPRLQSRAAFFLLHGSNSCRATKAGIAAAPQKQVEIL